MNTVVEILTEDGVEFLRIKNDAGTISLPLTWPTIKRVAYCAVQDIVSARALVRDLDQFQVKQAADERARLARAKGDDKDVDLLFTR